MDRRGFAFIDILVWVAVCSILTLAIMSAATDVVALFGEAADRSRQYAEFAALDQALRQDIESSDGTVTFGVDGFRIGSVDYELSAGHLVRTSQNIKSDFGFGVYSFTSESVNGRVYLILTCETRFGTRTIRYLTRFLAMRP